MAGILKVLEDFNPKVYKENNIRMMCPFRENHSGNKSIGHGEGQESFFLSLDKNVYHCWSCGVKGKATFLLTKKFDVPFYDAVEMVNLITVEAVKKEEYELRTTWTTKPPKSFLSRGVSEEILRKHLVGVDKKGNICIPLYDHYGKLKGVKYRNDRDFWYDANFDRKTYLYNFNPEAKEIIVVEGEVDCYFLEQWGYEVTALLGSHLTEEQADLLAKIPIINFALDNDSAGIKGMHGAYKLLRLRTDLNFINYPAKDPAECTRREFAYAYRKKCSYAEFKLLTT